MQVQKFRGAGPVSKFDLPANAIIESVGVSCSSGAVNLYVRLPDDVSPEPNAIRTFQIVAPGQEIAKAKAVHLWRHVQPNGHSSRFIYELIEPDEAALQLAMFPPTRVVRPGLPEVARAVPPPDQL